MTNKTKEKLYDLWMALLACLPFITWGFFIAILVKLFNINKP